MRDAENKQLAVLIDAENAQASICSELLAEIAKFGVVIIKRAYGDWTTTNLRGWKDHLHVHAIEPIQQFQYTTGKNAADTSLIIEAMDLLHEKKLDGFCIVSSDSDFTKLAIRIRESGLVVYGFGEQKTPRPFISACDKFVYTENLRPTTNTNVNNNSDNDYQAPELKPIIVSAIEAVSKEDGWATLAEVGDYINRNNPSFDPRNYNFEKLGKLIKSLEYVENEERKDEFSPIKHIYVKSK